jgi:hypothetical protein
MKKILLILGFCCSVNMLSAQENQHLFQDSHHNLIGNIRSGTIYDINNTFLGQFKVEKTEMCIVNGSHKTVGYIAKNTEFQDLDHHTIASITTDMSTYTVTVHNAQNAVLGYITKEGVISDANHAVIGYEVMAEPMWAAAYYFVFKF